jgi:hypothetical protein
LLQVLSLLVVQAHLDVCLCVALLALVLHFSDLVFPLLRFLVILLLLLPKLSYPSFENFIHIIGLLSHFYTLLALDIGILRLKVGQRRHNKVQAFFFFLALEKLIYERGSNLLLKVDLYVVRRSWLNCLGLLSDRSGLRR